MLNFFQYLHILKNKKITNPKSYIFNQITNPKSYITNNFLDILFFTQSSNKNKNKKEKQIVGTKA